MGRQTRENLLAFRTKIRVMKFPGLQANRPSNFPRHGVQPRSAQAPVERPDIPPLPPVPERENSPLPEIIADQEIPEAINLILEPTPQQVPLLQHPQPELPKLQTPDLAHTVPKGVTIITGYDRIGNVELLEDSTTYFDQIQ